MRPDETTAIRRRRLLFKAWLVVAIAGGLFIMFGAPFTSRYFGHEAIAIADLFVVFFLMITGIGWLVYLAMSKSRTRRRDATDHRPGQTRSDGSSARKPR